MRIAPKTLDHTGSQPVGTVDKNKGKETDLGIYMCIHTNSLNSKSLTSRTPPNHAPFCPHNIPRAQHQCLLRQEEQVFIQRHVYVNEKCLSKEPVISTNGISIFLPLSMFKKSVHG